MRLKELDQQEIHRFIYIHILLSFFPTVTIKWRFPPRAILFYLPWIPLPTAFHYNLEVLSFSIPFSPSYIPQCSLLSLLTFISIKLEICLKFYSSTEPTLPFHTQVLKELSTIPFYHLFFILLQSGFCSH